MKLKLIKLSKFTIVLILPANPFHRLVATFATYMYKKYKISGTAPSGVTVNIPHFAKRIIEYLGTTP